MPNLFQTGDFTLHSGDQSSFKIDCDALTYGDIESLAKIIAARFSFRDVVGVPRGGLRLAQALRPYSNMNDRLLIVDDVLTTGRSMEKTREEWRKYDSTPIGVVIFARGKCPDWVTPLFRMEGWD